MASHTVSARVYFLIFGALLALTGVTTAIAYVDLRVLNTILAISIAVTKALLVVLYFMHVRYSSRLTWVFAGAGFCWLIIMVSLTLSDFLTRGWISGL